MFSHHSNNHIDLTGTSFGSITIKKYLGKNQQKQRIYQVECRCGKQFISEYIDLKNRKVKSCGCKDKIKEISDAAIALNLIYSAYKSSARKRNLPFDLTLNEFQFYLKFNCHYCNSSPSNISRKKFKNVVYTYVYNGLDRLDSRFGYNIHNVISCCKTCNFAKGKLDIFSFINHAKAIAEHHKATPTHINSDGDYV